MNERIRATEDLERMGDLMEEFADILLEEEEAADIEEYGNPWETTQNGAG